MKRFSKTMLGVTLLEIMLVLAVAAMIIVMSVRYYQSATASQQANSILEEIQAITAAADGLAQATGTYSQVTTSNVQPLMPNSSMNTPWATQITVKKGTSSYTVSIPGMPANVCSQLVSRLAANSNYQGLSGITCSNGMTFTYTYSSQGAAPAAGG